MMNRERTIKSQTDGNWPLGLSLSEGRRSFLNSLPTQARIHALDARRVMKRFGKSLAFRNHVASKHEKSLGANSLDFIRSCFGRRLAPIEARGFSSGMIYKSLGGPIAEHLYTLIAQFPFSLSINQSVKSFNLQARDSFHLQLKVVVEQLKLLGQQTITEISRSTREVDRFSVIRQQSPGESSAWVERPGSSAPMVVLQGRAGKAQHAQAEREIQSSVKVIKNQSASLQRETDQVLRNLEKAFRSFQGHTTEREVRTAQAAAFTSVTRFRDLPPYFAKPSESIAPGYQKRSFMSLRPSPGRAESVIHNLISTPNQEVESKGWPDFSLVREERAPKIFESFATSTRFAAPETLALIRKIENDRRQSPITRSYLTELNRTDDRPLIAELKKTLLSFTPASGVRSKLLSTVAAYIGEGFESVDRPLTVIRRATTAETPSLACQLVQPMRPIADEQKVIKSVEDREVVAIVKKEVQALMKSGSQVLKFSRADYERIADKVYSSLVRRLMVEKERLGLG